MTSCEIQDGGGRQRENLQIARANPKFEIVLPNLAYQKFFGSLCVF